MNFLQPRLAAITDSPANLIAQLCELSELARAGQQSAAIYSANAARNRRKRKRGGSGFSRSIGDCAIRCFHSSCGTPRLGWPCRPLLLLQRRRSQTPALGQGLSPFFIPEIPLN